MNFIDFSSQKPPKSFNLNNTYDYELWTSFVQSSIDLKNNKYYTMEEVKANIEQLSSNLMVAQSTK